MRSMHQHGWDRELPIQRTLDRTSTKNVFLWDESKHQEQKEDSFKIENFCLMWRTPLFKCGCYFEICGA